MSELHGAGALKPRTAEWASAVAKALRVMAGTMPRVSIVINTACADPFSQDRGSPAHGLPYKRRIEILKDETIPRSKDFDDIIVAGSYPESLPRLFPHVRFVPVMGEKHDRWDALLQRETGARYASGGVIVFCHDDHAPGENLADICRALPPKVDILVPKRIHMKTGQEINNGREEGYMGGHCYAMRRWILAEVPLTTAPDEFWDIWLTPVWRKKGANIVWTDRACHYDCESENMGDNVACV